MVYMVYMVYRYAFRRWKQLKPGVRCDLEIAILANHLWVRRNKDRYIL